MVTRYSFDVFYKCVRAKADGYLIHYEDYQKLEAELEALRQPATPVTELFEELKQHSLLEVDFCHTHFAVTLVRGEYIKATKPEMLTDLLRAFRLAKPNGN